jgi:hypothetical protein
MGGDCGLQRTQMRIVSDNQSHLNRQVFLFRFSKQSRTIVSNREAIHEKQFGSVGSGPF